MVKSLAATATNSVGNKQARLSTELRYAATQPVDAPTVPSTLLVAHDATICKFVMVELRRSLPMDRSHTCVDPVNFTHAK